MNIALRIIFLSLFVATSSHGQANLTNKPVLLFATVEQGRQTLEARDEFVERLSPFDRSARMKTHRPVTEREFLAFVTETVLAWNEAEQTRLNTAFQELLPQIAELGVLLPTTLYAIKTTGKEEGDAAYTRANAIILPRSKVELGASEMRSQIAHEIFHILSRNNLPVKERLYKEIGFHPCGEIGFPVSLRDRKITNPDAPRNDHAIRVRISGEPHWVVPILFSKSENYDPTRGGEFFRYLQFQFLDVSKGASPNTKGYDPVNPKLVEVSEVTDFFEQVGRNTQYIIHPEEILADNFSLLLTRRKPVQSPEILALMEEVFRASRK